MDSITGKLKEFKVFSLIYVATLLLAFHFFFFYFISSSFLSLYASQKTVGYLFAAGGVINLLAFLNISKILRRFGNYKLILSLIVLEGICVLGLATIPSFVVIAPLFVLTQVINPILVFNLDIFLEKYSRDETTGGVRGIFLLVGNLPPVICPLIVGTILATPHYFEIFFISAVLLIPLYYTIVGNFRDFTDPSYVDITPSATFKEVVARHDVFNILSSNFLLNFFYCWMVIYMPIYLYQSVGFDWPHIGLMFSIMLLPFIIFQAPLGWLADVRYGEKEILTIGFVVMSLATLIIPFIHGQNFILWTVILFITRIGASFVELATTSYFFKQINATDINLIGLFRMSRVLPFIVVPIIVALSLSFFTLGYSFFILGLIMLIGLRFSLSLKDTR